MAEIKGNSFKSRQEKAETNPVKSKPQAKAKVKEKTFKQKVKDAFIAEDVVDIKEYLVFKVGIPGIKKMLRNMLVNSIDMRFFGKNLDRTSDSDRRGGTIVDYTRASRSKGDDDDFDRARRGQSGTSIGLRDLDLIMFESEDEAIEALRWLRAAIDDYGVATVSDFLEVAGLNANNIHRIWGWFNLDSASIKLDPDSDLYYVKLPTPKKVN